MIKFTTIAPDRSKIEILVIPVCEDADLHTSKPIRKLISAAKRLEEFKGKTQQKIISYSPSKTNIKRCLCMGVGPIDKINGEILRAMAGRAVNAAMNAKVPKIVIAVPDSKLPGAGSREAVRTIAEGACLANHVFDKYKEKSEKSPLKEIALLVSANPGKGQRSILKEVEAACRGTLYAREWINTPSNDKPPVQFAKAVRNAAKGSGLKISVMGEAQLQQKKFGALLAVSQGSAHEPQLVEMVYGPKSARKTIVLVGKGVTFDTGGINLKRSSGLNTMKADMSGAAAVAATLIALSSLKPRHRVVGILPLVENMPSGRATRPGDIVTSFGGKTVEIGNTDAEGRLILIDAMAYAIKKYKPHTLIDLATLTGACVVALGQKLAGVFSKDETLTDAIVSSGEAVHERCWPMPMPEDYKKLIKSDIADVSNMPSSRYGSAITAALFLAEFAGDTRWAHIDIAGPAYDKKSSDYCGPGGTGFGVRLLCDLIGKL